VSIAGTRYDGLLYRALNPIYARMPLSGRGAAIHGGRFNEKGREALYTALAPETAIREANQIGTLQPTTLVAYRACLFPVLDGRDPAALAAHAMTAEALADRGWRATMLAGAVPQTQTFARRLIEAGFKGLIVPSFAAGARSSDVNLVLWRWNTDADDRLALVDDEGRLG
jgi:RES domain-containing protein